MFKTKSENVIFKRSLKFRPVPSGPDRGKYAKITHLMIPSRRTYCTCTANSHYPSSSTFPSEARASTLLATRSCALRLLVNDESVRSTTVLTVIPRARQHARTLNYQCSAIIDLIVTPFKGEVWSELGPESPLKRRHVQKKFPPSIPA